MRCIFCLEDRAPSREHVFPESIGGTITTDRVCKDCNSTLGARVDAALVNFLPVRQRRAELALSGYSDTVPSQFSFLEGVGDAIGPDGNKFRLKTKFNEKTGKLEHESLTSSEVRENADGTKTLHFSVDPKNLHEIPGLIQRKRRQMNLRPLTQVEIAQILAQGVERTTDNPVIKKDVRASFAFLRHAMLKIAYELAFLWLGEDYLDDPQAAMLRIAIMGDLNSTDHIPNYIGDTANCSAIGLHTLHPDHHIAYASPAFGRVAIVVRVFDQYAAAVSVSESASRYFAKPSDSDKLRFLVIDASTRTHLETPFQTEVMRLIAEMGRLGKQLPLPDPLDRRPAV